MKLLNSNLLQELPKKLQELEEFKKEKVKEINLKI
jgi:hypothetical protein